MRGESALLEPSAAEIADLIREAESIVVDALFSEITDRIDSPTARTATSVLEMRHSTPRISERMSRPVDLPAGRLHYRWARSPPD
jgi:hypothetical protein